MPVVQNRTLHQLTLNLLSGSSVHLGPFNTKNEDGTWADRVEVTDEDIKSGHVAEALIKPKQQAQAVLTVMRPEDVGPRAVVPDKDASPAARKQAEALSAAAKPIAVPAAGTAPVSQVPSDHK